MKAHKQRKWVSYVLVAMLAWSGIITQAYAGMVGTQQIAQQASADLQRADLNALFARADVTQQLSALGVDPINAQDRIASLSDAEVLQLHDQISELPAGQGALGTIALVLLILILLDVAGVTDIFPKI